MQSSRSLAPLVEPVAELSDAGLERYSRHLVIPGFGEIAQRRLAAAKVLVIGAGGLGSPVLLYLAAAGVGTVGIVDDDVVDTSNLQRQVIHTQGSVGTPKTSSAAQQIRGLNPELNVIEHQMRLANENAVDLFSDYDLIVDGTDTFVTRYLVNDAAAIAGKPYVWGSILRFEGQISVFWEGHGPTYRDLFPEPPATGTVPSCADGGVLGVLCGIVGSTMAAEAIKLITGVGESALGKLLVVNALDMTWQTVRVGVDPEREPISELEDYDLLCGIQTTDDLPSIEVEELAGLEEPTLLDVREPSEWDIVHIEGATLVPRALIMSGERDVSGLAGAGPLYVYCKGGTRSAEVTGYLRERGVDAINVNGGVLAWVERVEPTLRSY